jgi:predicted nucleotidyltransferase
MRGSVFNLIRLAAIMALAAGWALPSEAASAPTAVSRRRPGGNVDCGAGYEKLAGKSSTKPGANLADLSKLIEKRFAGADLTWVEGKKRGARLEKFYRQLLELSDGEKAALLTRLRAAYPDLEEAPLLARIGFNDEAGWQKFFRESSSEPTAEPLMIGALRPLVEKMPDDTRRKILAEIGTRYPTAGKVPEGTKPDGRFWPKRLLDGWLRVLLKGDDTFHAGIAQGKSPLAAYQDYLNDVKGLVFSGAGAPAQYGNLSAEDLLGVATEIQKFLKLPTTKEQLYQGIWDENRKLLPPRVRIFGSTVKGTAKPGSDLDLGYFNLENHPGFGFVNGGERRGVQVPGLAPLVEKFMEKRRPGMNLNAGGLPHTIRMVDENLTALEPFMIEVTPDAVELLVFRREIEANKIFPRAPAIYQAPAPTRYRLR